MNDNPEDPDRRLVARPIALSDEDVEDLEQAASVLGITVEQLFSEAIREKVERLRKQGAHLSVVPDP